MFVSQKFGISGIIDNQTISYTFDVEILLANELADAFYDADEIPQWAIDQSWKAFVNDNDNLFTQFHNLLNPLTFQIIPQAIETMKKWKVFSFINSANNTIKIRDDQFLILLGGLKLAMLAGMNKIDKYNIISDDRQPEHSLHNLLATYYL